MKRFGLLSGGAIALALVSGLALAQSRPESLLPPVFDDPKPKPTPTPSPRPSALHSFVRLFQRAIWRAGTPSTIVKSPLT